MSNRTLGITIALALFASALAWLTRPSPTGAGEVTVGAGSVSLGIDPASVTRIEVESGGVRAAVDRGDGWTITLPNADENAAPARWPADRDAVRAVLGSLSALRVRADADRGHPEGAPSDTTIRVRAADRTHTVRVTGPPLAGLLPVSITTADRTLTGTVPADRLRPASVAEIAALAQPHPLRSPGVISAVAISAGDTRIAVERVAGLWTPAGTPTTSRPRVDQRAVGDILRSLDAVRMATVAVPFEETDEPASITVELTATLPRVPGEPARVTTTTLRVLGQANIKGDANAIVSRTTDTGDTLACRMTVNAQTFPGLPDSLDALMDPVPLPWPASDTAILKITRHSEEMPERVYRRTIEGWLWADPEPRPVGRAAIDTVLTILSRPQTASFSPGFGDRRTPVRSFTVEAEPIGVGAPVNLRVMGFDDATVVVHMPDGHASWQITDDARALGEALGRLASPVP